MLINFFYMLGMSTTLFILALMLVGGLGDYLKNALMVTQNNILVMTIGCLLSVFAYVSVWLVCSTGSVCESSQTQLYSYRSIIWITQY